MTTRKHIAVFCSAVELDPAYVEPAKEFVKIMAMEGYDLVWGGTDTGLMKTIADIAQENGRELIGVTMDIFKKVVRQTADEIIVAPTLGERKETMLYRSDAIVVLVGGIGTLDEITDVMELKREGKHHKPIVVLNTNDFYEGFRKQLKKMDDEGFMPVSVETLVHFADTPSGVLTYIDQYLQEHPVKRVVQV